MWIMEWMKVCAIMKALMNSGIGKISATERLVRAKAHCQMKIHKKTHLD